MAKRVEKRTEEGWKKKKEYTNKHLREEMHPVCFRFIKGKDDDIIEHLSKVKNKSQYLKDVIRADMNKGK